MQDKDEPTHKYLPGKDYKVYNARNGTFRIAIRRETQTRELESLRLPFYDKFGEMIKGNTLVEIGPGSSPQEGLWQYDPKKVVLVEPTWRRFRGDMPECVQYARDLSEGCDGATYLREDVEDDSVVVVSAAVFDWCILHNEDYARDLVSLIQRKTIPGGLTLHSIDDDHFVPMFIEAGFKPEPNGERGNLHFFRKP